MSVHPAVRSRVTIVFLSPSIVDVKESVSGSFSVIACARISGKGQLLGTDIFTTSAEVIFGMNSMMST